MLAWFLKKLRCKPEHGYKVDGFYW